MILPRPWLSIVNHSKNDILHPSLEWHRLTLQTDKQFHKRAQRGALGVHSCGEFWDIFLCRGHMLLLISACPLASMAIPPTSAEPPPCLTTTTRPGPSYTKDTHHPQPLFGGSTRTHQYRKGIHGFLTKKIYVYGVSPDIIPWWRGRLDPVP